MNILCNVLTILNLKSNSKLYLIVIKYTYLQNCDFKDESLQVGLMKIIDKQIFSSFSVTDLSYVKIM